MSKKINEICVQYANKYGGGLPLTPQEVCNATVLWVEEQLNNFTPPEGDGVTVAKLMELIKGSDTVVVDENEAGTALEIHLDYTVVAKLDRAILTPVSGVEVDSVPVVMPNGNVTYTPKSKVGLVTHKITFSYNIALVSSDTEIAGFTVYIHNDKSTPYTYTEFLEEIRNGIVCPGYFSENEEACLGSFIYNGNIVLAIVCSSNGVASLERDMLYFTDTIL